VDLSDQSIELPRSRGGLGGTEAERGAEKKSEDHRGSGLDHGCISFAAGNDAAAAKEIRHRM
jgi:hypothetical protein